MNLKSTSKMWICNLSKLEKSRQRYYSRNLITSSVAALDCDVQIIKCHWSKKKCSCSVSIWNPHTTQHTHTKPRNLLVRHLLSFWFASFVSGNSVQRKQTADAQQMKCNHRTKWSSYACVNALGYLLHFQPQKSSMDFKLLMLLKCLSTK